MTVYRIRSRFVAQPAVTDWREQLASRLGCRPRRLGRWSELGLYGALECLAMNAENALAKNATMVLSSQHGPSMAMRTAMEQSRDNLPLPLTFLQTQPSQLLATLSAQLQWCGDARFITHQDPLAVLSMALTTAGRKVDGLLLGWVDDIETESSLWLRLQPVADPGGLWQQTDDFSVLLQYASYMRLVSKQLEVIIAPNNTPEDQVY